ncbi:MAG: glycoside hydrolase domain-containing protein [Armatimonadota bacterium]|jgi:hypothetical protein
MRLLQTISFTLLITGCVSAALAQENLVPNPSFEAGDDAPAHWTLSDAGGGFVADDARSGARSVAVTGIEPQSSYWANHEVPLVPGRLYHFSVHAKSLPGTIGQSLIVGPSFANRDLVVPGEDWEERSFVFVAPDNAADGYLRVGHWKVDGTVLYDDVAVTPVQAVQVSRGELTLGEGESVLGDTYRFAPRLSYRGSNYSRPLHRLTAGFNTHRWVFSPGREVSYHFALPGARQTAAEVSVAVRWHARGDCLVEAGVDGESWTEVGRLSGLGEGRWELPAALFPADEVFVRLRSRGDADGELRDSSPGSFQVYAFEYQATLDRDLGQLAGATHFVVPEQSDERVDVTVRGLGELLPGGRNVAELELVAREAMDATARLTITRPDGSRRTASVEQTLEANAPVAVRIPYEVREVGEQSARLEVLSGGETLMAAEVPFTVPEMYRSDFGYPVAADDAAEVWWCESTYRVMRERPAPEGVALPPMLDAARNEWEALQIVVRPTGEMAPLEAAISDFRGPDGATIPAEAADILEVAYVPVRTPSDRQGSVGLWPDPLPPLDGSVALEARRNQPLWVRVHVPGDARAGIYRADLTLSAGQWKQSVPITLQVRDFALPDTLRFVHTQGLITGHLPQYHRTQTDEQLREVFDLYMRNFREHGVDPYHPMALGPMREELVGEGDQMRVEVDFSDFDREMERYIDGLGLRTFRLTPRWMPRKDAPGQVGPFTQGDRQYDRIVGEYLRTIEEHLVEKGWIEAAIAYWIDEPTPEHYENVIYGMRLLNEYAPRIKRLLTERVVPELVGHVDIWCPVLNQVVPEDLQERITAGDEAWNYVCTGPKAPHAGLFIDHNAIDLRVWTWMAWKWEIVGSLIWRANYWHSPGAPGEGLQDPWTDPMSYRADGGQWGNGDGRLIYPPRVDPNEEGEPIISGPIDSIRWEMLRDGFEDYEYFALLSERVAANPNAEARALLEVPAQVAASSIEFSRDPQPLYAHRRALARAIERLGE